VTAAGKSYLGLGGRLTEGPSEEMIEAGFGLESADAPILHDGLAVADLAHALVLVEAGYVTGPDARRLLSALLEMREIPVDLFPYDPRLGDAWNSRYAELTRLVGGLAGWLTVGRPRREAGRVAFRIALRARILEAHRALVAIAEAVHKQAKAHRGTVMADYTYLQPAQPTTLGYLLLSYIYPVLRDAVRLRRVFASINHSPAGAGGNTGSSLPLDRARLAKLLGFDGLALHARDAMWQTDDLVELLAVVAGAATHAAQIASDLEIFASSAFGFVELADSHSRASALMPQKKNPYSLAVIRGYAGVLDGRLTGLLALLKTGSGRSDHFIFGYGEVARALDMFSRSERLLAGTLDTLRFDRATLANSAYHGYLGAADLAEALVLEGFCDHPTAHKIVGAAVRTANSVGRADVTAEDISEHAVKFGVDLPPDEPRLQSAISRCSDPMALVRSRTVIGGSGAHSVAEMLRASKSALREQIRWNQTTASKLNKVNDNLVALLRKRK
jgi:argininosuccinate lyase